MRRLALGFRRFGRVVRAAAVVPALVTAGAAQVVVPPQIRKPIDAAEKAASKTSQQVKAAEKAGVPEGGRPATAAAGQAQATQRTAPAGRSGGAAQREDTAAPGAAGRIGRRGQVVFYREVFNYSSAGRRDPFVSLMLSGELRPLLADLSLIGVIYDPSGRRSIATLVDGSTGESYRAKVGDMLGRMRVTKIGAQDVTMSIDEFGFSRTETIVITRKAGAAPAVPRKTP